VVHAVAAAARRQACITVGRESERERSQTEQQCEQDGEGTPHLVNMVQELRIEPRFGKDKAFRYHRCISISQHLVEGFDAVSSEKFCLGERFIRN
jgi:hypothetical protein